MTEISSFSSGSESNSSASVDGTAKVNSQNDVSTGTGPGVNLIGQPVNLPRAVHLGTNPEDGGHDRDEIERFIDELCFNAPGLIQTVRAEGKDLYPRFHSTDAAGLGEAVRRLDNLSRACQENNHLYIQVSTCAENPNAGTDQPEHGVWGRKRGGISNTSHLLCLWNDIDFGTTGHADAPDGRLPNPPDAETAHQIYANSGLPGASAIVNSGGGLYEITFLDEPFDLTDENNKRRAISVARRWQQLIEKTAREMGYFYGAGVSNLERLLRVPGTVNTKQWDNKRRATVLYNEDEHGVPRYSFDELEALINALHPEPKAPTAPDGTAYQVERAKGDPGLPGNDFNTRGDWKRDILDPAGFTYSHAQGSVTYWGRPGKDVRKGHGFSLDHVPGLLFAFTDGTALRPNRYYDKFAAYAHLFHGSDFKAAAASLRSLGYGSVPSPRREDMPDTEFGRLLQNADERIDGVDTDAMPPTTTPAAERATEAESDNAPGTYSSPEAPMRVARELEPTWIQGTSRTLHHWRDQWMRWTGTHWTEVGASALRSKLYLKLEHAIYKARDPKTKELEDKAWNPSQKKISNLVDAIAAVTHLDERIEPGEWLGLKKDGPRLISCANVMINPLTKETREHTPAYFTTSSVPYAYDPAATCPQWEDFLEKVFPGDKQSQQLLQEWMGYVISGWTHYQKGIQLLGPPRAGKGTVARIMEKLIGKENSVGTTLKTLVSNFGMHPLIDKSLCVIGDAHMENRNASEIVARILSITGEDSLTVDRKNRSHWTGKIPARMMILANKAPRYSDSSGAITGRFMTLHFTQSFAGREDKTLETRLSTELAGILNWALEGLRRLDERGHFIQPESAEGIIESQREESAPHQTFVEDKCVTGSDDHWIVKDQLFYGWTRWCGQRGIRFTGTSASFAAELYAAVPGIRSGRKRVNGKLERVFYGITVQVEKGMVCPTNQSDPRETKKE